MMVVSKLIASCFGIGYIQKGAGTVAALFCCAAWYVWNGAATAWFFQAMLLLVSFFVGVLTASRVEPEWGKDSNRVVLDEVHGMLVSLFLLPPGWKPVLAALFLFRAFDIAKPLGIRKLESLPGGWGVMMDDLLAGLYSNVVLHLIIKTQLFA